MLKYASWDLRLENDATARPLIDAGIPYLNALVLAARGMDDPSEAMGFCRADGALYDPYLLPDMDKAVARIRTALKDGETIAVYGDYDLDGITSTAILYSLLVSLGARCERYVPDRLSEGHGLRTEALEELRGRGVTLVITVDTGVTALKEALEARSMGLDLIVTDHHECRETLPGAVAVVNPKIPGSRYPFTELAGVGVAFKLACALTGDEPAMLERFGEWVAMGTVADVAVLLDENRRLVREGLLRLSQTRHPGLNALLTEGARDERVTSQTVAFRLAPRLNAAGRLGRSDTAMELLLCGDPAEARRLASELSELNQSRKALEQCVMEAALRQIGDGGPDANPYALVLSGKDWHPGVTGIVAGQLAERRGLPAFLICVEDGEGKGSARGVPGVSLPEALEHCSELLEEYGGHALAAGFRVREERIPALREALNEYCRAALSPAEGRGALETGGCPADAEIQPEHLGLEDVRRLRVLEPFGAGNPEPCFVLREVKIQAVEPIGGGAHVRLKLEAGRAKLSGVWFFVREEQLPVGEGDFADVLFTPEINRFRDRESVQLQLRDIRPSQRQSNLEDEAWDAYRRFCEDETSPLPHEAFHMRPHREHMGMVWRRLIREGVLCEEPRALGRLLAGSRGLRLPLGMVWVTLDILAEYHLISLDKGPRWRVEVPPDPRKTDITRSGRLAALDALI